jgi:hypothetical protein
MATPDQLRYMSYYSVSGEEKNFHNCVQCGDERPGARIKTNCLHAAGARSCPGDEWREFTLCQACYNLTGSKECLPCLRNRAIAVIMHRESVNRVLPFSMDLVKIVASYVCS